MDVKCIIAFAVASVSAAPACCIAGNAGLVDFGVASAYTNQWSPVLNAEIDGRIERFRKADGDFTIPGLVAGTEVSVEQIGRAHV